MRSVVVALAIITLAVGGCASLVGADFDGLKRADGSGESSNDPTIEGEGPSGGGELEKHVPDVPAPTKPGIDGTCPSTTKKCNDLCVSPADPAYGCGSVCAKPCPNPSNGTAVCNEDACGIVCDANHAECTPGTCAPLRTFYEDKDKDGWGSSMSTKACSAPAGFVEKTGDCHDLNADVHPGVTETQYAPYITSSGAESFDYDCNGFEEVDPSLSPLVLANPTCEKEEACTSIGKKCFRVPVKRPPASGLDKRCGARLQECTAGGWQWASNDVIGDTGACR